MMDIKSLPENVRSHIRSSTNINSAVQCITELVLNSLDAKSTAIAVRVNFIKFQIQVVDNGTGIIKPNMDVIGNRFMTSKCHSLDDLKKIKSCGFRGEALASIKDISKTLTIASRPKDVQNTYSKTYKNAKWETVELIKQRPSQGTTITIEGFMYNLPVRQKRLNQIMDVENIRKMLETLAIIHYNVTFTLRNDVTGKTILKSTKTCNVSESLINFHPEILSDDLLQFKITKGKFTISGLIYKKSTKNNKQQYIYLNRRIISSSRIQKMINNLLTNSTLFQKISGDEESKTKHQKNEHPLYVINIQCPYSEVDLTLSPSKKTVEFKNWNGVTTCIEKSITAMLKNKNYFINNEKKNNKKIEVQECKSQFGVSIIKDVVKSKAFKRKIIENIIDKPILDVEGNSDRHDGINSGSKKSILNEDHVICEIIRKDSSHVEVEKSNKKNSAKKRAFDESGLSSKSGNDSPGLKNFVDSFLLDIYNEEPKNKKHKDEQKGLEKKIDTSKKVKVKKATKLASKKSKTTENRKSQEVKRTVNDSAFSLPKFYDMEIHTKKNCKIDEQKLEKVVSENNISVVEELASIKDKSLKENSIVEEVEEIQSPKKAGHKISPLALEELELQHNSIFEPIIDTNILEAQDEGKRIILNMFLKSLNQYQANEEDDNVERRKTNKPDHYQSFPRICFGKHTLNAMNMPRFGSFECFRQTSPTHNRTFITNTTKQPNFFSSEININQELNFQINSEISINQELNFQGFPEMKSAFTTYNIANTSVFHFDDQYNVSNYIKRLNEGPVPLYTRHNSRSNFINFKNNYAHKNEMPWNKNQENFFQKQAFNFCTNVEKTFNSHLFNNNLKFEFLNFNNQNLYNKPFMDYNYNLLPSNQANPSRNACFEFKQPTEPITKRPKNTIIKHNKGPNNQLFSPYFAREIRKRNVLENGKRSDLFTNKNNVTTSPYFKNPNKKSIPNQFHHDSKRKGNPIINNHSNRSSMWHTKKLIGNELFLSTKVTNLQPNQDLMFDNKNYYQPGRFGLPPNQNNNALRSITSNHVLNKPTANENNVFQTNQIFNMDSKIMENCELTKLRKTTKGAPLVRPSHFQNSTKIQNIFENQKLKQEFERVSHVPFTVPQSQVQLNTFHELQKEIKNTFCGVIPKINEAPLFKMPNARSKLALKKFSTEPFFKLTNQFPKQTNEKLSHSLKKFKSDPLTRKSSTNFFDLHNFNNLNTEIKETTFTEQNVNLSFTPSEVFSLRLPNNDKFETSIGSFRNFKPLFESSGIIVENENKHSDVVEGTLTDFDNVFIPSLSNFQSNVVDNNIPLDNDNFDVLNNQKRNSVAQNCSFLNISIDVIKEALPMRNQSCKEIACEKQENLNNPQIENHWIEFQDAFGEIFYINKRTGMTSKSIGKQDTNFVINKRIGFVPKGFSQILTKNEEIKVSLSPKSKKALNMIILESYEDELNTVKWSNYIHENEDVQKFFDELYLEKTKRFDSKIPNGNVQQLPKSMIKMYNNLEAESFTKDMYSDLMVIGQVDKKFIAALCQSKNLLVLFDQHAVHERVRLELLLEAYKDNETDETCTKLKSTKCQEKIIIELPKSDLNILIKYQSLVNELGLQFNVFQTGIEITYIPNCVHNKISKISKKDQENELKKFIETLIQEEINTILTTRGIALRMPTILQNIINSEACRGAIKFGDELSSVDCEELIKLLFTCQLPFQCAHGRPTIAPIVNLNENIIKEKKKLNFHNLK